MAKKQLLVVEVKLDKIVGGGQSLGTLDDGKKIFVWGGLPGETVRAQVTKKKSSYLEATVTEILESSPERIEPADPVSYLSTSPWQIMNAEAEQHYKAALIEEAFELHDIVLPEPINVYTDGQQYQYRNKVEFSWYGDDSSGEETLHLAFFRRGTRGKIAIDQFSLLPESMLDLAKSIRDTLQLAGVSARQLKTLLIRSDRSGNNVWQLYVKDTPFEFSEVLENAELPAQGGEIIYSNPKSPASVITDRLWQTGEITLTDEILGVPFRYAAESFFQINIPVYEQSLRDIKKWVPEGKPVTDLYSGVGSIGLTVGNENTTLVEINEYAVSEMRRNIQELGLSATPVLSASEDALDYIASGRTLIVDPPRAGMHTDVIDRILEVSPARIIYLSCNPVTQARDIARLAEKYGVKAHTGYNFFPRTPHIEHLVILDLK